MGERVIMNREILFKAKRKDNGEWIQGYYYQIWQQGYILWGMINNMPDMVEVTSVVFECPYCEEENEYDYSEFCDLCGHPSDWDYEILECQKCGKKFEIQGQEWS